MKKPYYKRVLLVLTAAFNVIVLNGAEDHTTSGRVGWKCKYEPNWFWLTARKIINTMFFWQDNHCTGAIEHDEYVDYSFFGWNILTIAAIISLFIWWV